MGTVGGFMRDRLHVDPRHLPGYDLAASIAGGLSQSPAPPPDDLPPAAQAGYLVTQGLQGADPAVKTAVMTAVAASPAMRQGAAAALGHIAAAREGWWPRFLRAVGLRK
jgi:hypothetical protein